MAQKNNFLQHSYYFFNVLIQSKSSCTTHSYRAQRFLLNKDLFRLKVCSGRISIEVAFRRKVFTTFNKLNDFSLEYRATLLQKEN